MNTQNYFYSLVVEILVLQSWLPGLGSDNYDTRGYIKYGCKNTRLMPFLH